MNEQNVLVIKDDTGRMLPSAGIWNATSESFVKAIKEDWEHRLSKKKEFANCTLVEAKLIEQ